MEKITGKKKSRKHGSCELATVTLLTKNVDNTVQVNRKINSMAGKTENMTDCQSNPEHVRKLHYLMTRTTVICRKQYIR